MRSWDGRWSDAKIEAVRDNVSEDFVIVYRTCANLYGYGIDGNPSAGLTWQKNAGQTTLMWMGLNQSGSL